MEKARYEQELKNEMDVELKANLNLLLNYMNQKLIYRKTRMIISNNIKSDNIKSDGFIVPLKDMFTKSTTDKVIEKDGKKYTLKVANLNLSFVETAGYYTCLEYSNIKLKKDQELKIIISEPKMDQIPFRQSDIKIWKESEIEDFSSPNTSGKGLNSKVPQEACDSFLNQFLLHHNLIQIFLWENVL